MQAVIQEKQKGGGGAGDGGGVGVKVFGSLWPELVDIHLQLQIFAQFIIKYLHEITDQDLIVSICNHGILSSTS